MYDGENPCSHGFTLLTLKKNLRYKHYQLVAKPAEVKLDDASNAAVTTPKAGLVEADSVKEFGRLLEERGVYAWWRLHMGYAGKDP